MRDDEQMQAGDQDALGVVRRYVAQLDAALAGCDPAVRNDAVIDAESHLRAAISGGVPAERAVAEFGTPQEVARAYLEGDHEAYGWRPRGGEPSGRTGESPAVAEAVDCGAPAASVTPGARVPAPQRTLASRIPVIGIWIDPRAWGALIYFGAVGFALSLGYFIWSVTMGALVLGTAPLIIGVPLLVLLLGSARALCLFEGKVVETLLGVRMPRRVQPVEGADSVGFWRRILCWLRDVRSWLSLAYLLGNFFISVCTFALTITLCAASVSMILAPILSLVGSPVTAQGDDLEPIVIHLLWWKLEPDANGVIHLPVGTAVAMTLFGLCLATATLWLMRGLGWIYGHVVQAIQVARPQAVGAMPRGTRL
jgi:uncharacterized membrane protein